MLEAMRFLAVALLLASCAPDGRSGERSITFRLVNPYGDATAYIDWTHDGLTEIHGRYYDDDVRFAWFRPPCTSICEEIPAGECGCLECDPDPVMMEFQPFGEVSITWHGPDVYVLDEDSCGCTCVHVEELRDPATVVVGLVSWDSLSCPTTCTPDFDGLVHGATPDGNRLCGTRVLDIPLETDRVTLLMGTVCDSDWP
jgi:hypothetical protein